MDAVMKIKFSIILLLHVLLSSLLVAQSADTLNQTDENGYRQGAWIKKDKYGRVVYEGRFFDDVPVGEFRYFFDDGKLRARSRIKNDGQDSWTITYRKNGLVMSEGAYKNQLKDSVWTFYDVYGQKLTTETFDQDVHHGKFVTYYQSGDTTEILFYNKGLKDGPWKQFYKGGQLKTDGNYVRDTLDGPITFYHKNGRMMLVGSYKMGLSHGTWKHFDEQGKVTLTDFFEEGVKVGQETLIELKKTDMPKSGSE